MKVFQLHPTLECNQECTWCPYKNKNGPAGSGSRDNEIPFPEIQRQLTNQWETGCRILKISGGGEPTLYRDFHELLHYASNLGYVVYLQTNGTLLDSFIREYTYDIRLSFGDGIPFSPPLIRPDGFSYVVSKKPEYDNLMELIRYAQKHGIYVRVTKDDTDLDNIPSIEEIKENLSAGVAVSNFPPDFYLIKPGISETERLNSDGPSAGFVSCETLSAGVAVSNFPVRFWDAHNFHKGKNPCPCHDSPLFTPFGWFPCCKTHVAKGVVPGYNEEMTLGWEYPDTPYDGSGCSRCYY